MRRMEPGPTSKTSKTKTRFWHGARTEAPMQMPRKASGGRWRIPGAPAARQPSRRRLPRRRRLTTSRTPGTEISISTEIAIETPRSRTPPAPSDMRNGCRRSSSCSAERPKPRQRAAHGSQATGRRSRKHRLGTCQSIAHTALGARLVHRRHALLTSSIVGGTSRARHTSPSVNEPL